MRACQRCKSCWWWNQVSSDNGNCLMSATQDEDCITPYSGYCQDYVNRNSLNKKFGTLKKWCEKNEFRYVIYKELM